MVMTGGNGGVLVVEWWIRYHDGSITEVITQDGGSLVKQE